MSIRRKPSFGDAPNQRGCATPPSTSECSDMMPTVTSVLEGRSHATRSQLRAIRESVLRLLHIEWPSLKNSSLLGTWRERDRMMRAVGPPMTLVHWATIARLGRIPHSSEGESISMDKAAAIAECHGMRFFIEMFSHRWCSPDAPDDEANSKAAALVEWAKYRWSCGLATFFWVDYACIDQKDISPGVCMLPLYVSSCNNILCYDSPEYEARAWCRVERLMFTAFVAPNNEFISHTFTFDPQAERLQNGELKPQVEDTVALPDPSAGELSHAEDAILIEELKALCSEHWGKCWKDGLMDIAEQRLEGIRSLEFGATKVRFRCFSPTVSPAAPDTTAASHIVEDSVLPSCDGDPFLDPAMVPEALPTSQSVEMCVEASACPTKSSRCSLLEAALGGCCAVEYTAQVQRARCERL